MHRTGDVIAFEGREYQPVASNEGFDNIMVYFNGGRLTFDLRIGRGVSLQVYYSSAFEVNVWAHFCVSVDVRGTVRAFKNGISLKSCEGSGYDCSNGVATQSDGWTPARVFRPLSLIGRANWASHPDYHGAISNLVICEGPNAAVVTEEAASTIMFQNGDTSLWVLPFDAIINATTNSTLNDGIPASLLERAPTNIGQWIGTVHNGTTTVHAPGFNSQYSALAFGGPGTDGHVAINGGTMLGGGALSVCGFAKYNTFSYYARIIDFGNGEKQDNILLHNLESTSALVWDIYRDATFDPTKMNRNIIVNDFWALGEWVHFCATVDAGGSMRVFKNGVERNCTGGYSCSSREPNQGWTPIRKCRKHSFIGRSNWATDAYFNGSISSLMVVDGHALSSDEVREHYNGFFPTSTTISTLSTTTTTASLRVSMGGQGAPGILNDINASVGQRESEEAVEVLDGVDSTIITTPAPQYLHAKIAVPIILLLGIALVGYIKWKGGREARQIKLRQAAEDELLGNQMIEMVENPLRVSLRQGGQANRADADSTSRADADRAVVYAIAIDETDLNDSMRTSTADDRESAVVYAIAIDETDLNVNDSTSRADDREQLDAAADGSIVYAVAIDETDLNDARNAIYSTFIEQPPDDQPYAVLLDACALYNGSSATAASPQPYSAPSETAGLYTDPHTPSVSTTPDTLVHGGQRTTRTSEAQLAFTADATPESQEYETLEAVVAASAIAPLSHRQQRHKYVNAEMFKPDDGQGRNSASVA